MLEHRNTGHNTIHLIYPLRLTNKNFNDEVLKPDEWQELYKNDQEQQVNYFFGSHVAYPDEDDAIFKVNNRLQSRKPLPVDQITSYFHPSVQHAFFHDDKRLVRAYRYNGERVNTQYYGWLRNSSDELEQDPQIRFEWLTSELYVFSSQFAYLVVRVTLTENWLNNSFQPEERQSLNVWMQFLNRIRQNYTKYRDQGKLFVKKVEEKQDIPKFSDRSFFDEVQQFVEALDVEIRISDIYEGSHNKPKQALEANTFVHAHVNTNIDSSSPLTEVEHLTRDMGTDGANRKVAVARSSIIVVPASLADDAAAVCCVLNQVLLCFFHQSLLCIRSRRKKRCSHCKRHQCFIQFCVHIC